MSAQLDFFAQATNDVKPASSRVIQIHPAPAQPSTAIEVAIEAAVDTLRGLIRKGHLLAAATSGGKESSVTSILTVEAIRRERIAGTPMPFHAITTSSTGMDNPTVEAHVRQLHVELEAFAMEHDLPVMARMVYPSLASSFVGSTVGRGTLPRFPDNAKSRTCSSDWKVKPQQRLTRELGEESMAQGFGEVVAVIGTRRSESRARAVRMSDRQESAQVATRDSEGRLTISVIADWNLNEVWDALAMFMEPGAAPFPAYISSQSMYRLFDIYRDMADGQCGIVTGDNVQRTPCGSRSGCHLCTLVASDKSMESMLATAEYEHLRGLNALRNLLFSTQYDTTKREWIGRTVSAAGHVAIQPDVYSLEFRKQLLRHMITLDVLEEERAGRVDADLATGKLPRTAENLLMAEPQFQMVDLEKLLIVDWQWSLHHYSQEAFPAIAVWHDIRTLGRRYPVPTLETTPKVAIPAKRWYRVGEFNAEVPVDGLRDYLAEQWGPYLHPERVAHARSAGGEMSTWFAEDESLSVDAEKAYELVEMIYPQRFVDMRRHSALDGARLLISEEIIKLPKGMSARYQLMAKRGQYFQRLMERLNMGPLELDQHLLRNSIDGEAHAELLGERTAEQPAQGALFGDEEDVTAVDLFDPV